MKTIITFFTSLTLALTLSACSSEQDNTAIALDNHDDGDAHAHQDERGPNNGYLLHQGGFTIELAIIEGAEPQYRAWASLDGEALPPEEVNLEATLTRLGSVDYVGFTAQRDYLVGDMPIAEPHSFVVEVRANLQGNRYQWEFESFEGRTEIAPDIAQTLNIETEIAGPRTLALSIPVYGHVVSNTERLSHVSARFDGRITQVHASIGEFVEAGATLATIESNQSLTSYKVTAPISGIVLERDAGPGEQAGTRTLFTIMDNSQVWIDLSIFPEQLASIAVGTSVNVTTAMSESVYSGTIARILPQVGVNQAVTARINLDNAEGHLLPGAWVEASVKLADVSVPLAVRREALQSFRDFTVVYAKFDNQYEVRMLELGRQSDEWVEVLSGLEPGTRYVTRNSYVIKADIEKDGATHDH